MTTSSKTASAKETAKETVKDAVEGTASAAKETVSAAKETVAAAKETVSASVEAAAEAAAEATRDAAKETEAFVAGRMETARVVAGDVATAFAAGGRAYVTGVGEIGRALFGIGKELASEGLDHAKATFRARDFREVVELQAAYAQHRLETSVAHLKEVADLTQVKTKDVFAPFADLAKARKVA